MSLVTVHAFWIWDGNDNKRAPRMASLETITRIKGEPIDGTARSVDESDLDGQGYYPRKLDFAVPELDVRKLVTFQLGGGLAKEDIDHLIAAGFLKVDGVNLIFTGRGEAALLLHLPI